MKENTLTTKEIGSSAHYLIRARLPSWRTTIVGQPRLRTVGLNRGEEEHEKILMGIFLLIFLLICSGKTARAIPIGNDIVDRPNADTWASFTMVDQNLIFPDDGKIDEWSIYAKSTGDVYLQVFRLISGNNYELIGQNYFSGIGVGINTFNISETDQISVLAGDLIGWTFGSPAIIPFSGGGNVNWANANGINVTTVGNSIYLPGNGSRIYSISANLKTNPVPEPASMLLFGTGLASLAGLSVIRKKKMQG